MKDTIISGSGNSRSIKTVPNIFTLAPTYEKFLELLAGDGLPIDILGLNPLGLNQHGTDLIKSNLLTDETEASIFGSTANRTPNDALAQLNKLVESAQNTSSLAMTNANEAIKKADDAKSAADIAQNTADQALSAGGQNIIIGDYYGNGSQEYFIQQAIPQKITTKFAPKAVLVFRSDGSGGYVDYGVNISTTLQGVFVTGGLALYNSPCQVRWNANNYLAINIMNDGFLVYSGTFGTYDSKPTAISLNTINFKYHYIAFG